MIWRSTFKQTLAEYAASVCSAKELDLLFSLWYSYGVNRLVSSAYFELLRVGDHKCTLIVQRSHVGHIVVRFDYKEKFTRVDDIFID